MAEDAKSAITPTPMKDFILKVWSHSTDRVLRLGLWGTETWSWPDDGKNVVGLKGVIYRFLSPNASWVDLLCTAWRMPSRNIAWGYCYPTLVWSLSYIKFAAMACLSDELKSENILFQCICMCSLHSIVHSVLKQVLVCIYTQGVSANPCVWSMHHLHSCLL